MKKMNKQNKSLITDVIDIEVNKENFAKKFAVKKAHIHPEYFSNCWNKEGKTNWSELNKEINKFTSKALNRPGALSTIATSDYKGGKYVFILVDAEFDNGFTKNFLDTLDSYVDIQALNISDLEQENILNLLMNALYKTTSSELYISGTPEENYLIAHKLSFKHTDLGLAFINESVTFTKKEDKDGDYDLRKDALLYPNNSGTGQYAKKGYGGPKQHDQLSIQYNSGKLGQSKLYKRFEVAEKFNREYKGIANIKLEHRIDGWTVFEPKESVDANIKEIIKTLKTELGTVKISYHPNEKEHAEWANTMKLVMVGEGTGSRKGEFPILFEEDQVLVVEEENVDNFTPTIRLVKSKEVYAKNKQEDIYDDRHKNVQHLVMPEKRPEKDENGKEIKQKVYKKKDFKALLISALSSLHLQTLSNYEELADFDGWEFYEFEKSEDKNNKQGMINVIKINGGAVTYEKINASDITNLFGTSMEQDEMRQNRAFFGFKTNDGQHGYVNKLSFGMSEDYQKIERKTISLIREKNAADGDKISGTFATGDVAEEHLSSLLGIGYYKLNDTYYYYSSPYKKSGIKASSDFTRKPRLYKLQAVSTDEPLKEEVVEKLLISMNNKFINVGRNATIPLPVKVLRHCLKYNL